MRAGLVFVMAALLMGGGFREWRRSHAERFQDLVEDLEAADARRVAAGAPRSPQASDSVRVDSLESGAARGFAASAARDVPVGRIDPNRATAAELERLPGIGPSLAARIVADRDGRGPFAAPESLLRVHGIGPKILGRIRAYLLFPPPSRADSLNEF